MEQLGSCERVFVEKEKAIIVSDGTYADAVAARIQQLEDEVEESSSSYDQEKLQERVAALGGGVAKIKVGGPTETEVNDKKLRYSDALNAVRSAKEMGIIPGGGSVLLHLSQKQFVDAATQDLATEDERA